MMPATHLNRQRSARSLDQLYEMPRETVSLADWLRLRHRDLPDLADLDLDRERVQLSTRHAYETDAGRRAWLAERRDAVTRQQRLRQRSVA